MEAIGCLVPELQSEMRSRCGTQLLKKTQYFYTATVNSMSSYTCYVNLHVFLYNSSLQVGKDSWERQLGKTVVVKAGLT